MQRNYEWRYPMYLNFLAWHIYQWGLSGVNSLLTSNYLQVYKTDSNLHKTNGLPTQVYTINDHHLHTIDGHLSQDGSMFIVQFFGKKWYLILKGLHFREWLTNSQYYWTILEHPVVVFAIWYPTYNVYVKWKGNWYSIT